MDLCLSLFLFHTLARSIEVCFINVLSLKSKITYTYLYYASVIHKDQNLQHQKNRWHSSYEHIFVRAGPVLSCLLGASNSGSHSFWTILSSCTSSNNSETSNQCFLLNYGTHSKPLSWRFLIGNHPPKHMQTHEFQILIRLALENSGLNCTWLVCLIHF